MLNNELVQNLDIQSTTIATVENPEHVRPGITRTGNSSASTTQRPDDRRACGLNPGNVSKLSTLP